MHSGVLVQRFIYFSLQQVNQGRPWIVISARAWSVGPGMLVAEALWRSLKSHLCSVIASVCQVTCNTSIWSQNNSFWKGYWEVSTSTFCSKHSQLWGQTRFFMAWSCRVWKASKDGDAWTLWGPIPMLDCPCGKCSFFRLPEPIWSALILKKNQFSTW